MKLMGTGLSRGPRSRGMGAQMFNSDGYVRVEHFYPVPICFGVIRELMQHPLGVCVGFRYVLYKCTWRLHSEINNIMSCDVTLKRR